MTRCQICYSKSVIYKIYSNVNNVNKIYVGSTTNFRNRKYKHKCLSLNNNNKDTNEYKYYIYQYINENGGWGNFNMSILERYDCDNKQQLHTREAYYINKLKPALNKTIPLRTNREWKKDTNYNEKRILCDCGYIYGLSNKSRHLKSEYHINKITNPFYYTNL